VKHKAPAKNARFGKRLSPIVFCMWPFHQQPRPPSNQALSPMLLRVAETNDHGIRVNGTLHRAHMFYKQTGISILIEKIRFCAADFISWPASPAI
jgi:hypothetical protein